MRKFLFIFLCVMVCPVSYGFRIIRPTPMSMPLTEDQVNELNEFLEDLWNLQNGEYNFDIVTTTKLKAQGGDIWLIQTGSTVYIQYKANGRVYTITPDGL